MRKALKGLNAFQALPVYLDFEVERSKGIDDLKVKRSNKKLHKKTAGIM